VLRPTGEGGTLGLIAKAAADARDGCFLSPVSVCDAAHAADRIKTRMCGLMR
jgi:hypothetical protein